jgi:DNA-binding LacI/PurR family transcriptional regulator
VESSQHRTAHVTLMDVARAAGVGKSTVSNVLNGSGRAGLARCGIPGDGAGLLRVGDDAGARAEIRSFLASARPDAVLTGSDKIAIIVYSVAAELNLRVGPELAVVGFDGSVGASLLHPQLTSVVMPVEDIARRVVARALGQIEHGYDAEQGEIVATWLREGESTPARR